MRSIKAHGKYNPYCVVLGREPITSSAILIEGRVIECRHDRYNRGFTLQSTTGLQYKIGGTNTTSSIASHITLLERCNDGFDNPLTAEYISNLTETVQSEPDLASLDALYDAFRRTLLPQQLDRSLAEIVPGGKEIISASERSLMISDTLAPALNSALDEILSLGEEKISSVLLGKICSIVSLVPNNRTANFTLNALSSRSNPVKREAALSMRSFEFELARQEALAPYSARAFFDSISQHLRRCRDVEARVYLAEALGYFGLSNFGISETLAKTLIQDDDNHVRWASAVSLGRRGNPQDGIETLLKSLAVEDCNRTRQGALLSLGRLLQRIEPESRSYGPTIAGEKFPGHPVEVGTRDTFPGVRAHSCFVLGEAAELHEGIEKKLVEIFCNDAEYSVKAQAILALWKLSQRKQLTKDLIGNFLGKLDEFLSMPVPADHPASSYAEWAQLIALRLLASQDAYGQAASLARRLGTKYETFPRRSLYFLGLADAYAAEYMLGQGDPAVAAARIQDALNRFSKFNRDAKWNVPGDIGEHGRTSALSMQKVCSARRTIILAARQLREDFFSRENISELSEELITAQNTIKALLDGLQARTLEPLKHDHTAENSSTISDIEHYGRLLKFEALLIALREAKTGDLRKVALADIWGFCHSLTEEGPTYVKNHRIWQSVQDLVNETRSYRKEGNNFEQTEFSKLAVAMIELLFDPASVPNIESRLVGQGRARLALIAINEAVEDSSQKNIWLLDSHVEIVNLRVTISVELRSIDERLVVFCTSGDQVLGSETIHVLDGLASCSIEVRVSSSEESHFDVNLAFEHGQEHEIVECVPVLIKKRDRSTNAQYDEDAQELVTLRDEITKSKSLFDSQNSARNYRQARRTKEQLSKLEDREDFLLKKIFGRTD